VFRVRTRAPRGVVRVAPATVAARTDHRLRARESDRGVRDARRALRAFTAVGSGSRAAVRDDARSIAELRAAQSENARRGATNARGDVGNAQASARDRRAAPAPSRAAPTSRRAAAGRRSRAPDAPQIGADMTAFHVRATRLGCRTSIRRCGARCGPFEAAAAPVVTVGVDVPIGFRRVRGAFRGRRIHLATEAIRDPPTPGPRSLAAVSDRRRSRPVALRSRVAPPEGRGATVPSASALQFDGRARYVSSLPPVRCCGPGTQWAG